MNGGPTGGQGGPNRGAGSCHRLWGRTPPSADPLVWDAMQHTSTREEWALVELPETRCWTVGVCRQGCDIV
jgi:hypothetical protein